jgi:putative transposase
LTSNTRLVESRAVETTQMAVVLQAYRYALDPTPRQGAALASHTGASRFAYNWGLELIQQRLEAKAAGQDVLAPWSLFELRREWNQAKQEAAPWWAENSKEAYSSGLSALARALKNWQDSKQGRRLGAGMGFPRRKRKGNGAESCRFTTGAIRVEADRHHVTLPRLGLLRTHESTRKLARRLERGAARIMAATITRRGGRWYVSFTCQVERAIVPARLPQAAIGVDVGIRHLAVLSDGQLIPNPAPLQRAQHRLRRLNRQLARRRGPRAPDGSQRAPSAGWRQTRRQLVREHVRIANRRHNSLHQLTNDLAETYGTIVVERLNIAGLLKNRRLARQLADASLGKLRRQLAYKTIWAGSALVEAERFFPSSKICSGCGHVKAKLPLSEREYRCECCGLVLDRDVNAARNLAVLVESSTNGVARSGLETRKTPVDGDSRPDFTEPSPTKREAGTEPRGSDQTGTADW